MGEVEFLALRNYGGADDGRWKMDVVGGEQSGQVATNATGRRMRHGASCAAVACRLNA